MSASGLTFRTQACIAAALVAVGVAGRLLPHPLNFTPLGAIALFAAAWLPSRGLALCVPWAALLISDRFLPSYNWVGMAFVYYAYAVYPAIGLWLKRRRSPLRIGGAALAGAVAFFLVSNFGVWVAYYKPTWAGLVECFTLAVPFFRGTVAGDLVYTTALFGGLAVVEAWVARTVPKTADDAAVEPGGTP